MKKADINGLRGRIDRNLNAFRIQAQPENYLPVNREAMLGNGGA
jgi:hypothetical protein